MKTILVVEDSRMIRTTIEKDLTRAGYSVTTAMDGEDGLRSARECRPDLILLDMLLPKMTGLDLLAAIRADKFFNDVPVVVLTGLSKGNADRLKRSGAAAFFEKSDKSFQEGSRELIRLIENVMKNGSNGKK
ncbi:MAG TPA: response regulator [Candidatus Sulfotelmatobacter sp.]|nr:response regulator [Candidatus Sulfotelmatobacter sp.]